MNLPTSQFANSVRSNDAQLDNSVIVGHQHKKYFCEFDIVDNYKDMKQRKRQQKELFDKITKLSERNKEISTLYSCENTHAVFNMVEDGAHAASRRQFQTTESHRQKDISDYNIRGKNKGKFQKQSSTTVKQEEHQEKNLNSKHIICKNCSGHINEISVENVKSIKNHDDLLKSKDVKKGKYKRNKSKTKTKQNEIISVTETNDNTTCDKVVTVYKNHGLQYDTDSTLTDNNIIISSKNKTEESKGLFSFFKTKKVILETSIGYKNINNTKVSDCKDTIIKDREAKNMSPAVHKKLSKHEVQMYDKNKVNKIQGMNKDVHKISVPNNVNNTGNSKIIDRNENSINKNHDNTIESHNLFHLSSKFTKLLNSHAVRNTDQSGNVEITQIIEDKSNNQEIKIDADVNLIDLHKKLTKWGLANAVGTKCKESVAHQSNKFNENINKNHDSEIKTETDLIDLRTNLAKWQHAHVSKRYSGKNTKIPRSKEFNSKSNNHDRINKADTNLISSKESTEKNLEASSKRHNRRTKINPEIDNINKVNRKELSFSNLILKPISGLYETIEQSSSISATNIMHISESKSVSSNILKCTKELHSSSELTHMLSNMNLDDICNDINSGKTDYDSKVNVAEDKTVGKSDDQILQNLLNVSNVDQKYKHFDDMKNILKAVNKGDTHKYDVQSATRDSDVLGKQIKNNLLFCKTAAREEFSCNKSNCNNNKINNHKDGEKTESFSTGDDKKRNLIQLSNTTIALRDISKVYELEEEIKNCKKDIKNKKTLNADQIVLPEIIAAQKLSNVKKQIKSKNYAKFRVVKAPSPNERLIEISSKHFKDEKISFTVEGIEPVIQLSSKKLKSNRSHKPVREILIFPGIDFSVDDVKLHSHGYKKQHKYNIANVTNKSEAINPSIHKCYNANITYIRKKKNATSSNKPKRKYCKGSHSHIRNNSGSPKRSDEVSLTNSRKYCKQESATQTADGIKSVPGNDGKLKTMESNAIESSSATTQCRTNKKSQYSGSHRKNLSLKYVHSFCDSNKSSMFTGDPHHSSKGKQERGTKILKGASKSESSINSDIQNERELQSIYYGCSSDSFKTQPFSGDNPELNNLDINKTKHMIRTLLAEHFPNRYGCKTVKTSENNKKIKSQPSSRIPKLNKNLYSNTLKSRTDVKRPKKDAAKSEKCNSLHINDVPKDDEKFSAFEKCITDIISKIYDNSNKNMLDKSIDAKHKSVSTNGNSVNTCMEKQSEIEFEIQKNGILNVISDSGIRRYVGTYSSESSDNNRKKNARKKLTKRRKDKRKNIKKRNKDISLITTQVPALENVYDNSMDFASSCSTLQPKSSKIRSVIGKKISVIDTTSSSTDNIVLSNHYNTYSKHMTSKKYDLNAIKASTSGYKSKKKKKIMGHLKKYIDLKKSSLDEFKQESLSKIVILSICSTCKISSYCGLHKKINNISHRTPPINNISHRTPPINNISHRTPPIDSHDDDKIASYGGQNYKQSNNAPFYINDSYNKTVNEVQHENKYPLYMPENKMNQFVSHTIPIESGYNKVPSYDRHEYNQSSNKAPFYINKLCNKTTNEVKQVPQNSEDSLEASPYNTDLLCPLTALFNFTPSPYSYFVYNTEIIPNANEKASSASEESEHKCSYESENTGECSETNGQANFGAITSFATITSKQNNSIFFHDVKKIPYKAIYENTRELSDTEDDSNFLDVSKTYKIKNTCEHLIFHYTTKSKRNDCNKTPTMQRKHTFKTDKYSSSSQQTVNFSESNSTIKTGLKSNESGYDTCKPTRSNSIVNFFKKGGSLLEIFKSSYKKRALIRKIHEDSQRDIKESLSSIADEKQSESLLNSCSDDSVGRSDNKSVMWFHTVKSIKPLKFNFRPESKKHEPTTNETKTIFKRECTCEPTHSGQRTECQKYADQIKKEATIPKKPPKKHLIDFKDTPLKFLMKKKPVPAPPCCADIIDKSTGMPRVRKKDKHVDSNKLIQLKDVETNAPARTQMHPETYKKIADLMKDPNENSNPDILSRPSDTDKEVFDRLLDHYEASTTIAKRLSKDEEFFREQLNDARSSAVVDDGVRDPMPSFQLKPSDDNLFKKQEVAKVRGSRFTDKALPTTYKTGCEVEADDIGTCFARGFRPDNLMLSGDACFNLNKQDKIKMTPYMLKNTESIIDFSERETPLDFLLALGFMVDEASNALKDDDIRSRLLAGITEARVWINKITTTQGTLLYLVAYKARPETMRYFLQLVEAIINKRINNAIMLDGFLRVLEQVEDGRLQMVNILGEDKFEDEENEERIVKKQLKDLFVNVYSIADEENKTMGKTITPEQIKLLRILVAKYRAGLQPHLELIARYIGQGLLNTEIQLEAAMIFLSRLDTAEVKLKEFENYCGIRCEINPPYS